MERGSVGGSAANRSRRLFIGFCLLILVDLLWVGSSELTKHFQRPYYTTYVKTCLFSLYLLGFMFHRPWRDQCMHPLPDNVESSAEEEAVDSADEMSEPEFEPIAAVSDTDSVASEPIHASPPQPAAAEPPADPAPPRSVSFSRIQEVRRMPSEEGAAATMSRLPYEVWLRARNLVRRYHYNKLPVRVVAKLALHFCFIWFLGNFAYQEALLMTSAGVVNVLSSSSSLFTLILAGIFPATAGDRFTLSKLVVVALSLGGVGVVSWVDEGLEGGSVAGAVWGLVGAVAYAVYLVFLRRQEKLDIPMFFGFVGLFSLVLLWPGLWILNQAGLEPFYPLPTRQQLLAVVVNGIVGTVLSEYLWLWGCFLTNSLIATLAISLSIPLTVLADSILWEETYPYLFYAGAVPILVSFILAAILAHYENWDPFGAGAWWLLAKLCHFPALLFRRCARRIPIRTPGRAASELDREQTQSLIINS